MKIDIRSIDCLYAEINGYTYYIDDSTNEQIIQVWKNDEEIEEKCDHDLEPLDYNDLD